MKKSMLFMYMLASSLFAFADDYAYLTVGYNSIEQSIELATIQKITFDTSAEKMTVTTSTGNEIDFPLTQMEKMFFSATATAVESLPEKSKNMSVSGGVLRVSGNDMLYIYGSNGMLQQITKVKGSAAVSLQTLPKGVYIVRMGNQTIKISK